MRRTAAISLPAILLCACACACGSGEREEAPVRERATSDEPLEIVRPALIDDGHEPLGLPPPQTYEVLEALTTLLVPVPPEGECALLAEDEPGAPLGAILAPYVRDADTREVSCTPALGGFQCRISLIKSTGGEEEEYGVFLDLQMDGAHAIEPRSIVCQLAG